VQNEILSLADFWNARLRIAPHVRQTPMEHSQSLSSKFKREIFLKLENWQKTGSFKIRGALNKLLSLSDAEKRRGVITASAGNHGLGVAYASRLLDVAAKIVVPVNASAAKIEALRNYKVELIHSGNDYDEAEEAAWQIQKNEGLTFVHGFSDSEIIAGQGTIALEILSGTDPLRGETLPDVATIVVPIGGGGLISGIALASKLINPQIRMVGVQSEASPAMFNSLRAGQPIETPIDETIADGLAGRFVTALNLEIVQRWVDEVQLVSEDAIKDGMKLILETEHMLLEGSAAVGVAALLEEKISPSTKTVILFTGRNIHSQALKNIL
jgi:threonine dehydratase